MKLYNLLERCTRFQYHSLNRQRLNEFKVKPDQKVILVTSRLAYSGLLRTMESFVAQDFNWDIIVIDVAIASWITIDMIAEKLGQLPSNTLIIIPGKTIGDEQALERMIGVPVYRGTECYSELSAAESAPSLKLVKQELPQYPRIAVIGLPNTNKNLYSKKIAELYQIPTINPIEIIEQKSDQGDGLALRAKDYINKGLPVPYHIMAEIIRSRLNESDTNHGYVLDGYPKTPTDMQWLENIKFTPDIVVSLVDDSKIKTKKKSKAESIELAAFNRETEMILNYYKAFYGNIIIDCKKDISESIKTIVAHIDTLISHAVILDEKIECSPSMLVPLSAVG